MGLQVLSSAELKEAMQQAEEEEESNCQGSASSQRQARASADLLVAPAQPQGYVEHWLASSMGDQQQNQTPDTEAAADAGSGAGPSVASLVQHFEALPTDQSAAVQPPLIELAAAEEPICLTQPARSLANKLRLAPLQIDDDLILPEEADSEAAAAAPESGHSPETAEVGLQTRLLGTAVVTPRARRQSALQGAAARNQAAIATHRARLHMKEQHSAAGAAQHGWATPVRKTLVPASPRSPATQRSSLTAGLLSPAGVRSSPPVPDPATKSPRPALTRFGSVANPSKLQSAQSLSPGVTIRRGGSAAFPSPLNQKQRPLPSPRAKLSSPTLQRGGSVTIAQIMKQNSRLPPLNLVPSAPSSPRSSLQPLPPLRRGSSVAGFSDLPLALKRGASLGTPLRRGSSMARSGAASAAHHKGSSTPQASGSLQQQSESPPGSVESSPRHTSVTFSEESRHRTRLSPISPTAIGSAAPLMRRVSGNQGSPNRSAKQRIRVSWLQYILLLLLKCSLCIL